MVGRMDYAPLIEKRRARMAELEEAIAAPDLFDDRARAEEVMREHRRTQELLRSWQELCTARQHREEAQELAAGEDADLAEMAALELQELEPLIARLEEAVQYSLLPRDATEDRDAIISTISSDSTAFFTSVSTSRADSDLSMRSFFGLVTGCFGRNTVQQSS